MKRFDKKIMAKLISILLFLSVWFPHQGDAQALLPIVLSVAEEVHDRLGSDVSNIRVLTVDLDPRAEDQNDVYNIRYLLDGNIFAGFKAKELPHTHKVNLKGYSPGEHVLEVELVDENDNVLASAQARVNVDR